METCDLEAVLAIQLASPEAAQWTTADYDLATHPATSSWVAQREPQIVGFIVARQVLDEIEILNLAVRPDSRRQGVATQLVRAVQQWAIEHGAGKSYLEVRASNTAAIRFYERHSFRPSGRRARYYASPVEDAVILVSELRQI